MELKDLKGIGKNRLEAFHAVGIFSLRDLLFCLPVRYEDQTTVCTISECGPGNACLRGVIAEKPKLGHYKGITRVYARLTDATGSLNLCWFNQPWMMNQLPLNQPILIYGRISIKNGCKSLNNGRLIESRGIVPVYKPIPGIPAKTRRDLVRRVIESETVFIPDPLPQTFRERNKLIGTSEALREVHCPSGKVSLFHALRRFSYERVLCYLTYVYLNHDSKQPGHAFSGCAEAAEEYWTSLPFSPTDAQRRVLSELAEDFESGNAMARLVQGDVGCGKTALAFGAVFLAQRNGFQSAMMAPTEILAKQHYESAQSILKSLGLRCRLLTGSTKSVERKEILQELRDGTCDVVFGTHALLSDPVIFRKLGLAITDEQHRFGVRQRTALSEKGIGTDNKCPHVLVMSATPIPRTLALILYGDLSLSIIDELPPGRIPVLTRLVPEHKRVALYGFIREQVKAGYQAYIVCPLVEDSEETDFELQSAKTLYDELRQNELADLNLGLTWGSQSNAEKDRVLKAFRAGTTQVLISTTVIEVGVNVPNATVMVVENASQFGLSQLHQLRGRVGRGREKSWCFLLSEETEKLKVLCDTNDGFIVAQKDMEIRGPGDLLGHRQSGDAALGDMLCADTKLLDEVSGVVRHLFANPALNEEKEQIKAMAIDFATVKNLHMEKN